MKKNNSDSNFEISLKDFCDYCKDHVLLIVLTILIILLAHGVNIFYNNLGIDTQMFVQNPTYDYNWMGLGRFGLLLERNILYLNPFVSYYAGILMIVFIILSCAVMFYTFYKISNKDFGLINLCIPLICFTHPVFVEQFLFKLQCAEIACGAFITSVSLLWIFTWIKNNNYKYVVLGVIGLVISFASYQSYVFIYIAMCIFSFILLKEDEEERSSFKVILKLLATFIISYVIYYIIIKYVFLYLDFEVGWGQKSKREIIIEIINHIKNVLIGSGPHYNLGYVFGLIICFIILVYKTIKDNDSLSNKIWYFLSFGMLFASPFFLAVVRGGTPLLRSQLALPYCESFLIMFATYYLFKNKYAKYISLILVLCVVGAQMSITETFYYTDVFKTDFEIEISNQIVHDLKSRGIEEKSTIVVIGYKDPPFNAICKTGEIAGLSAYNAHYYGYPYYVQSTSDILGIWKCIGYDYQGCRPDQAETARRILEEENMPNWPLEGSIKNCGDFYILKLSDDNLPW